MSSPANLLALAGLGLVLGLRHAFEPDHLAAVSTLATRQGRLLDACRLGLAWALGHTVSVGVVVGTIILFGLTLPARFAPAADFLVALLLIGLGGSVLWRYARGRWHLHVHAHGQGREPHLHLHSHVHGVAHQHAHPRGDAGRSLGFGLLHGLAGSAALLLLRVSFSLAGMVRLAAGRSARWVTLLHLGSAAASAMVGVALAGRVAGVL